MKKENIRNSKGLICGKENKKIFSKYNTFNNSFFGLIDLDQYIINSSDEFSEEIIYNIFKPIFIMFEKFENKHFSDFYKTSFYDLIIRGKIYCKENNESFLNFLEDLYLYSNLLLNTNKKYKDFSHFLTTLEQLYIKNYTKNSIFTN